LARASQLYGSIGTVVVALSWFFIAGRLLVVSFTIDAVVWERFSSLASVLLRWSVLARLVERHRGIGRFLDLNRELTTADADPPGAGEGASSPVPEHDDDARVRR
jgi:hypothetical protein